MKAKLSCVLIYLAAIAFFAPCLRANDIPGLTIPDGAGVNIHFTRGHERDLDLIAAAGFKFVRQDFFWGSIEQQKGVYDWSEYDELVANLDQRGMHAYFILDYSNPLYEGEETSTNPVWHTVERTTIAPQHPDSVAAFARWAAAAAKHFHDRGVIWEIWNEPNSNFWQPGSNVGQYCTLALATCRAIREEEPEATIVGPATSGLPRDFLESVCKSGLLEYFDAVSVHPYRAPHQVPESAAKDLARLRALIKQYAPPGKQDMPILSGEWGYSSNTKGVTLERQAQFIVRQQLSNRLCGVPVSIWYDWKNDGDDPAENEHNFGTVRSDFTPKPAYLAVQTLTRELAGCNLARRLDTGNTNDYVLLYTNTAGAFKLAAWTIAADHPVSLPAGDAGGREFSTIDIAGNRGAIAAANGNLAIPLDGSPKFIDLKDWKLP